jgi:hypothetical protein
MSSPTWPGPSLWTLAFLGAVAIVLTLVFL